MLRRVDLGRLAEELSSFEAGDQKWVADPPGALTPRLRLVDDGESTLAPSRFLHLVERHLSRALPAWDPFEP